MPKIRILPLQVVAKIAAGEVIERPAFVVKELIDNAIDAGSTDILIDVELSGLKKISVVDNGEGMDQEDVSLCFQPHTTSKLLDENLVGIKHLGFRGEALASIAAVSQLTIKSKMFHHVVGTQVRIIAGTLAETSSIGMPAGTVVTVEQLFSHVPARKKFLKTAQTEFRHISDVVVTHALAFPESGFQLRHNHRVVVDLPQRQTLVERIKLLLGENTFLQFLPLTYTDSFLTISGFIAKPQLTSETLHKQYLFVNRRRVTDKLITLALKEAYGTLLSPSSHPLCVLMVELPYEQVDVNIHPRKEQVSFVNQRFVFDVVHRAVTTTLSENNLTFHNISWLNGSPQKETQTYAARIVKEEVLKTTPFISPVRKSLDILQLHNTYLVAETDKGIVLMDQHAVHERVLYEQFLAEFHRQKSKQKIVRLAKPLDLTLSISDAQILLEYMDVLKQVGFTIHHKTETQFIVSHVPLLFQDRNNEALILEVIADLAQEKPLATIDRRSQRMLLYLACRSAVKAGDRLDQQERRKLLQDLQKSKIPYTCPHGRPTRVEITFSQLERLFKRS